MCRKTLNTNSISTCLCVLAPCTCSEGCGDDGAGVEPPRCLELNSVLCGLCQSFQSNPRVLRIEDQLLI